MYICGESQIHHTSGHGSTVELLASNQTVSVRSRLSAPGGPKRGPPGAGMGCRVALRHDSLGRLPVAGRAVRTMGGRCGHSSTVEHLVADQKMTSSILAARSESLSAARSSRSSEEARRLQPVSRGFDSLSALHAHPEMMLPWPNR